MPRLDHSGQPTAEKTSPVRAAVDRCPARRRPRRALRHGMAAIEYCLLASMIAVVAITGVQHIGLRAKGVFEQVLDASGSSETSGGSEASGSESGSSQSGGNSGGNSGNSSGRGNSGKSSRSR